MPDAQMPRYQCHKKVWALKIAAIEFNEDGSASIAPADPHFGIRREPDYRSKFKGDEADLGYFVQYEGGYVSWSPSKAFEDGYSRIS